MSEIWVEAISQWRFKLSPCQSPEAVIQRSRLNRTKGKIYLFLVAQMVLFQPGIYQDRKRIATFCIINSEARQQEAGGGGGWGCTAHIASLRLSQPQKQCPSLWGLAGWMAKESHTCRHPTTITTHTHTQATEQSQERGEEMGSPLPENWKQM